MNNSLLVEALESLNKKERRHFRHFVHSPFFNRREDVGKAYDYLAECLWEHRVIPNKSKLFRRLFPHKAYDDHRVRVIMSFILQLLEQFFQYQLLQEKPIRCELSLARAYRRRKLERHFNRSLKRTNKLLDKAEHKNADHFTDRYEYQIARYQQLASEKRGSALNLQQINQELDAFYIISKLRQACLMLSHQAVYRKDYEVVPLLAEIVQLVQQPEWQGEPAIAIYYNCYTALSRPEATAAFETFKQLLFKQGQLFPPEEQQDLYLLGINFCIRRYNAGDEAYLSSQLELYQQGLQQGFLLSEGQLSRFTYRNMVTLGLILKEYEWVERFIYDYKGLLEPTHREGMFCFCLARLAYSKKDYGSALELLQQANYRDPLLHLSAKTVSLKIFYELEAFDALEAQLNALQVFLRRREAISYHRENYNNMLKYLRRLVEINPYDRKAIAKLKADMEREVVVAEKQWLLRQIEKMGS